MNPNTIRDYLQRTAMDEAQAEALSRIFAEMATRSDVLILEEKVGSLEERIEQRFVTLEEKFTGQMARLQADLTWKMIAIVGFFGTVITMLNAFIG